MIRKTITVPKILSQDDVCKELSELIGNMSLADRVVIRQSRAGSRVINVDIDSGDAVFICQIIDDFRLICLENAIDRLSMNYGLINNNCDQNRNSICRQEIKHMLLKQAAEQQLSLVVEDKDHL